MDDDADRYASIAQAVLAMEAEEAARQGEETDSRPRPPASADAIAAAEAVRGRAFPESYRAFLRSFDGWDYFEWGLSLFGTAELSGEAYDDAMEVFSYGDDHPDELAAGLLIGASEDNASRVLLLDSGEVVEWRYEEEGRHPDLASFLARREQTLIEMREQAFACAAATRRQWDPEVRAAADAALEAELRSVLEAAPPTDEPQLDGLPPMDSDLAEIAAADLVFYEGDEDVALEDGDVSAEVGLGLVLYLGAAPTHDEVLATYRAFRKHFPVQGPLEWAPAAAMCFSTEEAEDPDSEPFVDDLRIDDQGHFGLRAQIGQSEAAGSLYLLNVRAVPPGDEDEDEPVDRASFVEVWVPATEPPEALRALCVELVEQLPVRSGLGGWFARVANEEAEPDPWGQVLAWCRRHLALVPARVDEWLVPARTRHAGASWLTVLGRPFVAALGQARLDALPSTLERHAARNGLVLVAGETPPLGDVAQGELPEAIMAVARVLDPVSVKSLSRQGSLNVGGVWFSTSTTELPGAFVHHHVTEAFLQRLVGPASFVGPSPRERALALIDALSEHMAPEDQAEWRAANDLHDAGFADVMRALYNATCFARHPALVEDSLRLVVRYPDWSPPQAFNNLLHLLFSRHRTEEALTFVPLALHVAHRDPFIYHNAACILAQSGRHDEAVECVRQAKAHEYPRLADMKTDEDLAPIADRDDFRAIFG